MEGLNKLESTMKKLQEVAPVENEGAEAVNEAVNEEKLITQEEEDELLQLENDEMIVMDGALKTKFIVHNFVYDKKREKWVVTINGMVIYELEGKTFKEAKDIWYEEQSLASDLLLFTLAKVHVDKDKEDKMKGVDPNEEI